MYTLIFMSQAQKDAKKLAPGGLKSKALKLLEIIEADPYQYPPAYEFLYEVFESEKIIRIYRMWGHYE